MEQLQINVVDAPGNPHEKPVGDQLWLKFNPNDAQKVCLYRHDLLLKSVDLKDRVAKRLFVVEAVNQGANQTLLSRVLNISRQSIHNYMEIHRHFGLEGLINNYVPSRSTNLQKQREINREKRLCGNKARQLEQIRREERQSGGFQMPLTLADQRGEVLEDDQAFARCHDWQPTRYAGIICYLITLIHLNDWMNLVMAFFGKRYQVFMAFMLMVANGVRSIEQIKNLHLVEAGRLLGMGVFPNRAQLRQWLHEICQKNLSGPLLQAYFLQQVRCGVVGVWLWFADGHLLPYTGETRVHYAYNTQRQLAVPGRTNLVTCDGSGRVVDFQIQEGKGDLRQYLVTLGRKWQTEINPTPVMVFDREGYGAAFFNEMNQAGVQFVCWEKHIDAQTLGALSLDCFGEQLEVNGKTYGIFEGENSLRSMIRTLSHCVGFISITIAAAAGPASSPMPPRTGSAAKTAHEPF